MTKRVLVSVLLLLIAISLSVTSFHILQNRVSSLGEALQNAIYAKIPTTSNFKSIQQNWKNSEAIFHIFLLHSDLTDLETELNALPYLLDSPVEYRKSCIRSLQLVEALNESLELRLENIL